MLLGAPSLLALPDVTSSRKAAPKARDAATDTATSAAAPVQTRRKGFPIRIPRLTLGVAISLSALFVGCVLRNQWLVVLGIFLMLGLYLSRPHTVSGTDAGDLLVREVMLTEYTLLSSSDTLRGALDRTMHSLQDVFPVVRGDQLVGSVTRHAISYRFRVHGDSYLQGIMERKVPLAVPSEKLVDVLQRTSTPGSGEFIPVVEDGAMVGILTRQSLGQVVRQAKMSGPTPAPREQS
jgi:predicted transcriptional regulator